MNRDRNRVCPVELAPSLDNRIRRWVQNPRAILTPFVTEGMKVLDVGCGPGFFSIEMAELVGPSGSVIAADLQEGMLRQLAQKIRGSPLESRITTIRCARDNINVSEQVDFILAFYMVHEVPDKVSLFRQFRSVLSRRGRLLLVEPRLFHVSKDAFRTTLDVAQKAGFTIGEGPRLLFSWSAVLGNTLAAA